MNRPNRPRTGAATSAVVAVQILASTVVVFAGPAIPRCPAALALLAAAAAFMVWAVVEMRPGRFNLSPHPHRRGALHTRGPYRFVRHPMYLALLAGTLVYVADRPGAVRTAAWVVLLVDLLVKIRMEERMLRRTKPGYAAYCRRTARLVPFLY